jgi:hypothetical protein
MKGSKMKDTKKKHRRKTGSIIFVMGFTYGWLIPAILSGSIWSCQRKVLET